MQEDMTDRLVRLTKLYDDDSPVVSDPRSMEQTLEDFKEKEYLTDYFDDFNQKLSKKNLNSFLKGVINP